MSPDESNKFMQLFRDPSEKIRKKRAQHKHNLHLSHSVSYKAIVIRSKLFLTERT